MEIEINGKYYWINKGLDENPKYFNKRISFLKRNSDLEYEKAYELSYCYANYKLFRVKYNDTIQSLLNK